MAIEISNIRVINCINLYGTITAIDSELPVFRFYCQTYTTNSWLQNLAVLNMLVYRGSQNLTKFNWIHLSRIEGIYYAYFSLNSSSLI